MAFLPCLVRDEGDGRGLIRIGHPLLDAYLELVAARARPNTVLAHAFDLKVFFTVIDREPLEVVPADVLAFITEQRKPRRASNVVRIEDGEVGLSARTIKRRLATIAGLYDYLIVRGDVTANPVPRGLATRRGAQRAVRGVRAQTSGAGGSATRLDTSVGASSWHHGDVLHCTPSRFVGITSHLSTNSRNLFLKADAQGRGDVGRHVSFAIFGPSPCDGTWRGRSARRAL